MNYRYNDELEYKLLYKVANQEFQYPNTSMEEYDIRTVDLHLKVMQDKGLVILTPFEHEYYYENIEITEAGLKVLYNKKDTA